MKIMILAAATTATLLAGSAFAGTPVPTPLGVPLGSALPLAGIGLMGVAAASLVAGIRMLRRKQDR
jgi:hypothetical protein